MNRKLRRVQTGYSQMMTHLYCTASGALPIASKTAHISCLRLSAFLTAGESRDEPAAETQISDVDGRRDEETRGWIRVHYQDAEEKKVPFFSIFPTLVVHRQHVWDLVWSASTLSLQRPSAGVCAHEPSGTRRPGMLDIMESTCVLPHIL